MAERQSEYQTYLIRLWPVEELQEAQSTKTVWRVTLEDTLTHARRGFADLHHAFAFLQQQVHHPKEDRDEMD